MEQPITPEGSLSATVFDLGGDGGIYLRASHWRMRKLRITNGFFGVQTEGSDDVGPGQRRDRSHERVGIDDNILSKGAPDGIVVYSGSASFHRNRIALFELPRDSAWWAINIRFSVPVISIPEEVSATGFENEITLLPAVRTILDAQSFVLSIPRNADQVRKLLRVA